MILQRSYSFSLSSQRPSSIISRYCPPSKIKEQKAYGKYTDSGTDQSPNRPALPKPLPTRTEKPPFKCWWKRDLYNPYLSFLPFSLPKSAN